MFNLYLSTSGVCAGVSASCADYRCETTQYSSEVVGRARSSAKREPPTYLDERGHSMIHRNRFTRAGVCAIFALFFLVQPGFGQQPIQWTTQADSLRGRNGQRFNYVCPAGGPISSRLWGTNVYTDDSSICTAAVHAGYIEVANGGAVTIEIRPGQAGYQGVARNGVTSRGYGAYAGSFVFVGRVSGSANANWATQADPLRGRNGQRFTYKCPAGGPISGRLWGTDIYTDDSSICTAAVHAGLISVASGGSVTIEIRSGATSYRGSTRNNVTSRSYGGYAGSFVIVGSRSSVSPVSSASIDWSRDATSLRGRNGARFTFVCAPNGAISSRLWGSGLYTDDSSICTAAVHAGLISTTGGGTITIEIRPGAASYQPNTSNGVASRGYGSWAGSFVFVR